MKRIGIFPLGIVLFPESVYPLHIFEERYKTLVEESIANETNFGINLIDNKKMYDTGCTAVVSDVIKKYEDGKYDILVAGVKRYKLNNMLDGEAPYYKGDVTFFDDRDETIDFILLRKTVEIFNNIAKKITQVKIDTLDIDKLSIEKPSFYIAQKSGLTAPQKQELLEMVSETERLNKLFEHLTKLEPLIQEAEHITRILKYDGYLKPDFYNR